MTRLELASCLCVAAVVALATSAAAAPKKKPKPGAAPAASASAEPAASASAAPPPPPPPPPSTPSTSDTDEASAEASTASGGDKRITVGADLLFVLPVGDLSDATGPQIGPVIRGGYQLMPQLEITARIGYLFAFGKSRDVGSGNSASTSITDIPVWLGARYFLNGAPAGPYGAAELGLNFLNASASGTINGASVSQSNGDTRGGFNLGVGYVLSKDLPIDVRLQYSYYNLVGTNGEGALMGIGLSAGYSFFF